MSLKDIMRCPLIYSFGVLTIGHISLYKKKILPKSYPYELFISIGGHLIVYEAQFSHMCVYIFKNI